MQRLFLIFWFAFVLVLRAALQQPPTCFHDEQELKCSNLIPARRTPHPKLTRGRPEKNFQP